jgi:hypothetical protein
MGLEWPRERKLQVGVGDRSFVLRGAF